MTSYTFSSTMMYIPLSASLCVATSAAEKVFDMLTVCLFPFFPNLYLESLESSGIIDAPRYR